MLAPRDYQVKTTTTTTPTWSHLLKLQPIGKQARIDPELDATTRRQLDDDEEDHDSDSILGLCVFEAYAIPSAIAASSQVI